MAHHATFGYDACMWLGIWGKSRSAASCQSLCFQRQTLWAIELELAPSRLNEINGLEGDWR
jgi:hypothetical protein